MFVLLANGNFLKPQSFTDTENLPVKFYGRIRWERHVKKPTRRWKLFRRIPDVLKALVSLVDTLEELEICLKYRCAIVAAAKLEAERDLLSFKEADRIGPSDGFIFTHNGVNYILASYMGLDFYLGLGIDHVCSSGIDVLGLASKMIAAGEAEVALAATVNSMASVPRTAYHRNLGVLSQKGIIAPFDADRDGTVFSDGMAVAILCSEKVAQRENLKPIAAITGYGRVCDALHMFSLREDGEAFVRAVELSLPPEANPKIVKAHATGTRLNDRAEAAAYKRLFGKEATITALKPVAGHSVVSSGLTETLMLLKNIKEKGTIPPIKNLKRIDPECEGIAPALKESPFKGGGIVSVSAGFGGFFSSIHMEVLE